VLFFKIDTNLCSFSYYLFAKSFKSSILVGCRAVGIFSVQTRFCFRDELLLTELRAFLKETDTEEETLCNGVTELSVRYCPRRGLPDPSDRDSAVQVWRPGIKTGHPT